MIHLKHTIAAGALLTSAVAIAATINGTAGNDLLRGTAVGDEMRGYAGNDVMFGGGGNDTMFGGPGDDNLHGDEGINRLVGGDGADDFYIGRATQTTIDDVQTGEGVIITCAASWGSWGDNFVHIKDLDPSISTGDLGFHGRNGAITRFVGSAWPNQRIPQIVVEGGC